MKEKLRILLIILLVLGIFFRFVNLEGKSYWIDEVFTSLRISGYTQAEVIQELSQGQVISLEELQKYQQPNPEKRRYWHYQRLGIRRTPNSSTFFRDGKILGADFWSFSSSYQRLLILD